ncbi:MAG: hypothetical protein EBY07_12925 [Actinobacteria bacterium]|nr:hypothetical protein [Actinomycetota bacterium]
MGVGPTVEERQIAVGIEPEPHSGKKRAIERRCVGRQSFQRRVLVPKGVRSISRVDGGDTRGTHATISIVVSNVQERGMRFDVDRQGLSRHHRSRERDVQTSGTHPAFAPDRDRMLGQPPEHVHSHDVVPEFTGLFGAMREWSQRQLRRDERSHRINIPTAEANSPTPTTRTVAQPPR